MSLPDPLSISTDALAHHEAGHAVAATVLGIPYLAVRITPGEYGKTGAGTWHGKGAERLGLSGEVKDGIFCNVR